jgi:RIO-like serine/threonine protein kinase
MRMKKGKLALSDRQWQILRCIYDHHLKHGFPPTIREIGEVAGMTSTSVINYNIMRLVEYGLLARRSDISRSVTLQPEGYQMLGEALPESDEVRRLQAQLAKVEAENVQLQEENRQLQQRIIALKQTVISRVEAVFG